MLRWSKIRSRKITFLNVISVLSVKHILLLSTFFFVLKLIEMLFPHYFISFYPTPVANQLQHTAIFLGPVHLSQSIFLTVTCFFWSITVMLGTFKCVIVSVQSQVVRLMQSYLLLFCTLCSYCVEGDVQLSFRDYYYFISML